jgi:hypothetical protein
MINPMAMPHVNTMANKPAPTGMAYLVPLDTQATPRPTPGRSAIPSTILAIPCRALFFILRTQSLLE